MATSNSSHGQRGVLRARCPPGARLFSAAAAPLAVFLMLAGGTLFSQSVPAPTASTNCSSFAAFAEKTFLAARARFKTGTNTTEIVVNFARAAFEWAEFGTNDAHRAAIATEGIDACRALIAREPKLGAGHYYLALNLGRLADTKRNLAALRLVDEMEAAFTRAAALDPKIDFAGPDRGLGNLYLDAPGWPVSVGSKSKARQHLRRAVELCPDFPENQLCLIEAWLKWGDKKSARPMLATIEEVLRKARAQFTGDAWANAWHDWELRWKKIKERLK